jgi:hypothetical protein
LSTELSAAPAKKAIRSLRSSPAPVSDKGK